MFSQKEFVELSKEFVCVRLGTFENEEHKKMVESLLGSVSNTAFVIFAPDGKTRLTKTGRSPRMVWGNRGVLEGLRDIAEKYRPKADINKSLLQDFHSLDQALRTGAADQRLLVCLVQPIGKKESGLKVMQNVFNDPKIRGKVHFDTLGKGDNETWKKIEGYSNLPGYYIVQPGAYANKGKVVSKVTLIQPVNKLKSVLLKAIQEHAESEKRKVYEDHVKAGLAEGLSDKSRRSKGDKGKRKENK